MYNNDMIKEKVKSLIESKNLNKSDIADVIAEQVFHARVSDDVQIKFLADKLESRFGAKCQTKGKTENYNEKADNFGGYYIYLVQKINQLHGKDGIIVCLKALEEAYDEA